MAPRNNKSAFIKQRIANIICVIIGVLCGLKINSATYYDQSSNLHDDNSNIIAPVSSATAGHYIRNGSLFGNIHLSSEFTEEGTLKVPDGVNRIWIEIGANSR